MSNQTNAPRLATNLDELDIILDQLFTEESWHHGLAFKPRPGDIFISPYAKCGTTWLQHIAHGLRTRGNMDFDEITTVTPWISIAHDMNWDLEAEHIAQPRIYKSHMTWHDIPKGGRYICSFRHPADAFMSFYRFFENYYFEAGSISLEELFYWRYPRENLAEKGYWYHLASWWSQRKNPNVLLLCYEDMKADLATTIKRIATFMGINLDNELFDIILRQSSREFMLEHMDKFDEAPFRRHAYNLGVLPFEVEGHKVTPGASVKHKLSPQIEVELKNIWEEQITAKLGLKSYDDLRKRMQVKSRY